MPRMSHEAPFQGSLACFFGSKATTPEKGLPCRATTRARRRPLYPVLRFAVVGPSRRTNEGTGGIEAYKGSRGWVFWRRL